MRSDLFPARALRGREGGAGEALRFMAAVGFGE